MAAVSPKPVPSSSQALTAPATTAKGQEMIDEANEELPR